MCIESTGQSHPMTAQLPSHSNLIKFSISSALILNYGHGGIFNPLTKFHFYCSRDLVANEISSASSSVRDFRNPLIF